MSQSVDTVPCIQKSLIFFINVYRISYFEHRSLHLEIFPLDSTNISIGMYCVIYFSFFKKRTLEKSINASSVKCFLYSFVLSMRTKKDFKILLTVKSRIR
jgi:hypothetical protein